MALSDTDLTTDTPATDPSRRPRRLLASAAAVAVVVGALVLTVNGDDGDDPVASGPLLELSLGEGDAMASCIMVDAAAIAASPMAFAATATEIGDDTVVLEVDEWFTAGDASLVELGAPGGQAALIAGFDFQVGERYLISATDGSVNYCGLSGPATAELSALYDEAFGD